MRYITVKPHGGWAGIGHQFTNFIVAYSLAKRYDLKYVYQPFGGNDNGTHSPKGSNAYQITKPTIQWNDFLNFSEEELTLQDLPSNIKIIKVPYLHADVLNKKIPYEEVEWYHPIFKECLTKIYHKDVLFVVSDEQQGQFTNTDWETYKDNKLKQKYNNSKQIKNFKNYFTKDCLSCAIHIRRGDVKNDQQWGRWENLNYYINIIEVVSNIVELKNIKFHIYTYDMIEKEQKILREYLLPDGGKLELHIDECVFSTFYHLTKADILVMGLGTFSVLAAYLSNGIKICKEWDIFWKNIPKEIGGIIQVCSDGSFDALQFLRELEKKNEKI